MALAAAVVDGAPDARGRRVNSKLRPYQIFAVSPRYAGTCSGGPRQRDALWAEGTVWTWLLGTLALAYYLATGTRRTRGPSSPACHALHRT